MLTSVFRAFMVGLFRVNSAALGLLFRLYNCCQGIKNVPNRGFAPGPHWGIPPPEAPPLFHFPKSTKQNYVPGCNL